MILNKEKNQPPYVSDDFQIGPNGAYEHNEPIQIIDEAYKNYLIEDVKILPNMPKDKMTELGYRLTQEEFINKCKTDSEFSEKWGLKIEERELSWEERETYGYEINIDGILTEEWADKLRLPTKLITITYNNERIESYE